MLMLEPIPSGTLGGIGTREWTQLKRSDYYFIQNAEKERGRERVSSESERFFFCCFIPQMPAAGRVGPGRSLELPVNVECPSWWQGWNGMSHPALSVTQGTC